MDSSLSSLAEGRCMQDICADVICGGVDAIDHPAQIPQTHLLPTSHGEPSLETAQDHMSEPTKSTSTRSTSPGTLGISPELPSSVPASSSASSTSSSTSSARSKMVHLNVTTATASVQKFSPRSTLLPLQPDSPEGEREREDGRGPQPGTPRAFQGSKPPHLRRPSAPANHQLPPVPTPPGTPRSSNRQLRGPRSLLKGFTSLQERPSQPSRLCDHLHHHFPRSPTDPSVPPASPRQPRSPLGSFQEPPSSLPSAGLGSSSSCKGDLSKSPGEAGDPCLLTTARTERPTTPSSTSSPSYAHAAWQRVSSPLHDTLSRLHSRAFGWRGRLSSQGRAASPIIWSSPTLSEPLEEGPVPDHKETSPLRHSLMSALTSPLRYGNSDSNSSSGDQSRSGPISKAATRSASSSRVPAATATASGSTSRSIGSTCSRSISSSSRPHGAGSKVSYSSEFHKQVPHGTDNTAVRTHLERRRSSSSSCGGSSSSSSSSNWSSTGARAPPPDLFVNNAPSPPPPCRILLPTDSSAEQACGSSPKLWRCKRGLQGNKGADEEPREKGGDARAANMRMMVAHERLAAATAAVAAAGEAAAPAPDCKGAASAEALDGTGPWRQGTTRLECKSNAAGLGMSLESSPQHRSCFPQFHKSPLQPSLGRNVDSGDQKNIGVSVHADWKVPQYPAKPLGSSEHRESGRPLNAEEEERSVQCMKNTSSQPWGWKGNEGRAAAPPSLTLDDEGEQEWEWQPSQRDSKTPLGIAVGRRRDQATSSQDLNPSQTLMTSASLTSSTSSPSSSSSAPASSSSSPPSVSTVPAPFSILPWTPTGGSDDAPQVFQTSASETPRSAAFAAASAPPAGASQQGTIAGASSCVVFTADELKCATDGWSPSTVIGRGSFGTVYGGLIHGTPVAIKRQEGGEEQNLKPEYEAELKILSRVRGPHIVPLLGHSPEARALVYEYLPMGSLQDWLANCHKVPFTPFQRVQILCDIAYALLTLHGGDPPVVHRDLKPANVLLDGDMRAKLGDVGTACVLELDEEEGGEEDEDDHDVSHKDDDNDDASDGGRYDVAGPSDAEASNQPLGPLVDVNGCPHGVRHDGRRNAHISQESRTGKLLESGADATRWRAKVSCRGVVSYQVVGTVGYIDPEMMSTFRVNPAVDVYAFGLIALQLLTGEPKVTRLRERLEREADFTGCAADFTIPTHFSLTVKSVMRMADSSPGEWPRDVVRDVATLALRCASRHSVDRLCLESEVLPMLWRCMGALQDGHRGGHKRESL